MPLWTKNDATEPAALLSRQKVVAKVAVFPAELQIIAQKPAPKTGMSFPPSLE
jgi:hypothetical protein